MFIGPIVYGVLSLSILDHKIYLGVLPLALDDHVYFDFFALSMNDILFCSCWMVIRCNEFILGEVNLVITKCKKILKND